MTDTRKLYHERLDEDWAESLLSAPSTQPMSVYERLVKARTELVAAVEEAQAALTANPLTVVVADAAARRSNRRGMPSIVVRPDGSVFMEVHYKTDSDERKVRKWESYLPSLAELRKEAQKLGLDPAPFGRKRTELFKAVQEARAKQPNKKMFRTSQAVGPVTILD